MGLLLIFVSNVLKDSTEPKYRGINASGKAYTSKVKGVTGGPRLLRVLGWERVEGEVRGRAKRRKERKVEATGTRLKSSLIFTSLATLCRRRIS